MDVHELTKEQWTKFGNVLINWEEIEHTGQCETAKNGIVRILENIREFDD